MAASVNEINTGRLIGFVDTSLCSPKKVYNTKQLVFLHLHIKYRFTLLNQLNDNREIISDHCG